VSRLLATGLFGKARPAAATALRGEAPQFGAVKPEAADDEVGDSSTLSAPPAAAAVAEPEPAAQQAAAAADGAAAGGSEPAPVAAAAVPADAGQQTKLSTPFSSSLVPPDLPTGWQSQLQQHKGSSSGGGGIR